MPITTSSSTQSIPPQERVLEIRLMPIAHSDGQFELKFFSENIPDDRGALVALLEELIIKGKTGQLFPTSNETPVNDTEVVFEFTLTEVQDRVDVDVWVDNFPLSPMAILTILLQIHEDLTKHAQL